MNLRARRIQGKGEDSVVKIRPVEPDQLATEWRLSPAMKVEVDAMPGGYVCSASLKGKPATGDTRKVGLGEEPIRRLFSKDQRAFFKAHAPEGISMDSLSVLGPIFVLKGNFTPDGFNRQLTAEMWLYPDGRRLLELSTKCAPGEMMQAATEARLFFGEHGIDLSGAQETKTKSALHFFAKELQAAEKAARKTETSTDASANGVAAESTNGAAPTEADSVPATAPATDQEPVEAASAAADEAADDADPD
jgi:hypothetical protein